MPRSSRIALFACIASVACAAPCNASDRQEDVIDEIQVTASRRPVDAAKVSAALTLIDSEDIRRATLATDALANEVGVYLQQTTVGQGAAIIRGLKGSEILHLVDGLRLNNAIFRNAPTQYLALVAPGSIERIEILRGSPTSLYGSDAVGGVIQVISRLPRFDSDETGWRRELAVDVDSAELTKRIRGAADVGNRELAATFSGSYQDSGHRRTGSGNRIVPSAFASYSARTALVAYPAAGREWVVDLQFTRQPSTPRVDELVPGFGQPAPAAAEFHFEPNERWFAHARHRRDDGWLGFDWTIDAGWQRIVDDRRNRDPGSTIRRFEQNSSDLKGLSVSATRDVGGSSWVVGGELYHDTVHSGRREFDLDDGTQTEVQARFPDGAKVLNAALFVNLSRPVAARHRLSGGLRVNAVDIDLPATTIAESAAIGIEDMSADVGWLYDLSDATQIVANLGYGFRAPNVFDLGTLGERPGNRFNIPNPALASERVTQYDVALRHRGEDISGEFVVYRLDYRDRIDAALTGATTPGGRDIVQSRNLGRARIHGAEAGLQWHPDGGWSAEVVMNYTRGEQREPDGSLVDGDRIPPLNGRLTIARDFGRSLSLETSVVFADAQDRLSPRDVRDTRIDVNGTPGWAILNVGARWEGAEHWVVNAGVENLLDRRYRRHGSGIDARGVNVYLSATTRW